MTGQTEIAKEVRIFINLRYYMPEWTWQDFNNTPWEVVEEIFRYFNAEADKPKPIFHPMEVYVAKGIGRALGG